MNLAPRFVGGNRRQYKPTGASLPVLQQPRILQSWEPRTTGSDTNNLNPPTRPPTNQASKQARTQATSHLDGCQAAACHCSHTTIRICCTVLLLVGGSRRQYKPSGASLLILNRPGVMLRIATHPPHTPARPPASQPATKPSERATSPHQWYAVPCRYLFAAVAASTSLLGQAF
jgi:hypothetical protein